MAEYIKLADGPVEETEEQKLTQEYQQKVANLKAEIAKYDYITNILAQHDRGTGVLSDDDYNYYLEKEKKQVALRDELHALEAEITELGLSVTI